MKTSLTETMGSISVLLFALIGTLSSEVKNDTNLKRLPFSIISSSSDLTFENVFLNMNTHRVRSNLKKSTRSTRIVGGTEAKPNQFPYHVSIQVYGYFEKYDHICAGTIYDAKHVITAAHCLRGYHPRNLRVIAGKHDLSLDEGSAQVRDNLEYTFHQAYDPFTFDNDVAIITLGRPFTINQFVQPLSFPIDNQAVPSPKAISTGWGSTSNDQDIEYPDKLQFVELDIISRSQCETIYQDIADITPGMLCAGNLTSGQGSCMGDSGGPLSCKDKETGNDYLCGVVSWGMFPCGNPTYPTVFSNIAHYSSWFRSRLPSQQS